MTLSKKAIAAGIGSILIELFVIALFYLMCWTAAADAQGAIALFLFAPVVFAFSIGSFILGKYAAKTWRLGHFTKIVAIVLLAFLTTFYASSIAGYSGFSDAVIDFTSGTFKTFTGKTPMEWDKKL